MKYIIFSERKTRENMSEEVITVISCVQLSNSNYINCYLPRSRQSVLYHHPLCDDRYTILNNPRSNLYIPKLYNTTVDIPNDNIRFQIMNTALSLSE